MQQEKIKQRASMSLNKGFDLYFTIRLAFLICLWDEELWQKRTASTHCFQWGPPRPVASTKSRAVKNTARFPDATISWRFGGFTEKVLYNAALSGDYVIVKKRYYVFLHL